MTGMATVVTQTHFAGSAGVGMFVPNIDVVSLLPNGMVHDMGKTDSSGHLSIKVYPGGSVTAIYRHTADMGADLTTYVGVKPNDTLTFGRFWSLPQVGAATGSTTLSWPAYAGSGTLQQYYIYPPCSPASEAPSTLTAGFSQYAYCDHTPWETIGIAYLTNGQIGGVSYSVFNFTNGGSVGLNNWQVPGTAMGILTGLPPEVANTTLQFQFVSNGGKTGFAYATSAQPTGGAATLSFPWLSAGERTESTVFLGRAGTYYSTRVLDSLTSLTTTVASPQLPPWVGSSIASAADRKFVWFPTGTPSHDGNVALVEWSHTMGTATSQFSWTLVLPPDVSEYTLPVLPAIFDDTQPKPEDFMGVVVNLIEIPAVTGYDAFRALPEAELSCIDCAITQNLLQRAIVSGQRFPTF